VVEVEVTFQVIKTVVQVVQVEERREARLEEQAAALELLTKVSTVVQ
jgi:hypothetical protein